jgi:hypothetical protein
MSTVEGGGSLVQDNLVYLLDIANVKSYSGGDKVRDLSKVEKLNGNLINSPIYSNLNSGSFVFDGINQYISLDKNIAPTSNTFGKYSFSVWFSPSILISSANTNIYMIFEAQNTFTSGATDNYIQVIPSQGGKISFTTFNSSSDNLNTTTNVWVANKWYNITCTYDSTISRKCIYVNGVLENSNTNANNFFNTRDAFSLFVYSFPTNQYFFPGKFGNFVLYTKTLSNAEVLQNYNALKNRFGL